MRVSTRETIGMDDPRKADDEDADYCNRCRKRACGTTLRVLFPLVQVDTLDRVAQARPALGMCNLLLS